MCFLVRLPCRAFQKTLWYTPKSRICFYSVENYINLLFDLENMTAILDFTYNAMSYSTFWTYHFVGRTRKSHGRHQNHESATILKKMISIYCLTLNIWRPCWILHTVQCLKVRSGHTTVGVGGRTRKPHGRLQNHESATIL